MKEIAETRLGRIWFGTILQFFYTVSWYMKTQTWKNTCTGYKCKNRIMGKILDWPEGHLRFSLLLGKLNLFNS